MFDFILHRTNFGLVATHYIGHKIKLISSNESYLDRLGARGVLAVLVWDVLDALIMTRSKETN